MEIHYYKRDDTNEPPNKIDYYHINNTSNDILCNNELSDHDFQIYKKQIDGKIFNILNWNVIHNYFFLHKFNNDNLKNDVKFKFINLLNNTRIKLLKNKIIKEINDNSINIICLQECPVELYNLLQNELSNFYFKYNFNIIGKKNNLDAIETSNINFDINTLSKIDEVNTSSESNGGFLIGYKKDLNNDNLNSYGVDIFYVEKYGKKNFKSDIQYIKINNIYLFNAHFGNCIYLHDFIDKLNKNNNDIRSIINNKYNNNLLDIPKNILENNEPNEDELLLFNNSYIFIIGDFNCSLNMSNNKSYTIEECINEQKKENKIDYLLSKKISNDNNTNNGNNNVKNVNNKNIEQIDEIKLIQNRDIIKSIEIMIINEDALKAKEQHNKLLEQEKQLLIQQNNLRELEKKTNLLIDAKMIEITISRNIGQKLKGNKIKLYIKNDDIIGVNVDPINNDASNINIHPIFIENFRDEYKIYKELLNPQNYIKQINSKDPHNNLVTTYCYWDNDNKRYYDVKLENGRYKKTKIGSTIRNISDFNGNDELKQKIINDIN